MMDYQIVAGIDIPVSMSKNQLKTIESTLFIHKPFIPLYSYVTLIGYICRT